MQSHCHLSDSAGLAKNGPKFSCVVCCKMLALEASSLLEYMMFDDSKQELPMHFQDWLNNAHIDHLKLGNHNAS